MSELRLPGRWRITEVIATHHLWALLYALLVALGLLRSNLSGIVAVGLFALILIVLKPRTGLFLLLLAMPFQRTAFRHLPSWAFGLAGFATLVAIVLPEVRVRGPSFSRRVHPLEWLAVGMFIYSFASFVTWIFATGQQTIIGQNGLYCLAYTVTALFLFIAINRLVRSVRELYTAMLPVLAVCLLICVIAVHEHVVGTSPIMAWRVAAFSTWEHPVRQHGVFGIFYDPNLFGNYVGTMALLVLPTLAVRTSPVSYKVLRVAVVVLALLVLFWTFSLSSWLGFVAGLAIVGWYGKRRRALALILCAILVMTLVGAQSRTVLERLMPHSEVYRLARLVSGTQMLSAAEDILSDRISLDRLGLEMFRENPVLGSGYGSFAMRGSVQRLAAESHVSHNSYVLVLAEQGLLGIGLLLALIYMALRTASSNIKAAQNQFIRQLQVGSLAAIVANLVFCAAYASLTYNVNLWMVLGLTVAITRMRIGRQRE
ncbi:MAG: O-antigen ligase family protein [Chloroflexi bacterium]|nr:O-antigen ligase family protein [Chloroflexota bacterium]